MRRLFRILLILLILDNLLGNLLFGSISPDESISAYCWRRGYTKRIALIDWLMREKDHCKKAYESEKNGSHLAPEYRA